MTAITEREVRIAGEVAREMRPKYAGQANAPDLHDLVSFACQHLLESPIDWSKKTDGYVAQSARSGVLQAMRSWQSLVGRGCAAATRNADVRYVDRGHVGAWDQIIQSQRPPIELMIDLMRSLLRLRSDVALVWVEKCLLESDTGDVCESLACSRSTLNDRWKLARAEMRQALSEYEEQGPTLTKLQRIEALLRRGVATKKIERATRSSTRTVYAVKRKVFPDAKSGWVERAPVETGEVVVLRQRGLTHKQIAHRLNTSETVIERRIREAKAQGIRGLAKCGPRVARSA